MSGSSNDVVQTPTPDSHADSAGLVAIIVVLVLLILGSAAAYLLMRWHFAKRRGKMAAAGASGRERGGEQGARGSAVLMVAGEKARALEISERERGMCADGEESGLERRRSVVSGGGKFHNKTLNT